MLKTDMHIEIVSSDMLGLSSMSSPSRLRAQEVLSRHYRRVGITIVNTLSDLEALVAKRPDIVLLGMKFLPVHPELGQEDPDKIWLSTYLETEDIICTGSGQIAHALELDKQLAKQLVHEEGFATAKYVVMGKNQTYPSSNTQLCYPVFIKPTNRGGGTGIDDASVAYTAEQVRKKVDSIAVLHQSDSLVEEYLPGREFSVAILKHTHGSSYDVMPLELIAPKNSFGHRVLSAAVKSADTETFAAVTDVAIREKITELALGVFRTLGARDYGRIDIRLDTYGVPHFLEANLIPSLLDGYGNFPKACSMNIRLSYEQMLIRIISLAQNRRTVSVMNFDTLLPHAPVLELA